MWGAFYFLLFKNDCSGFWFIFLSNCFLKCWNVLMPYREIFKKKRGNHKTLQLDKGEKYIDFHSIRFHRQQGCAWIQYALWVQS
jgi:hypothetical protein